MLLLATLMVPFQVVLIPTLLIVKSFGLIDHLGALIVPNLVTAFGVFMMRQFFVALPPDLEEAGRIDGASRLGVFRKILLPVDGAAARDARDPHVPRASGTTSCGRSSRSRARRT